MTHRLVTLGVLLAGAALGPAIAFAHAPVKARFPAPGARAATANVVQIRFGEAVRSGAITVLHEGHPLDAFTKGLASHGKVLRASFPEGLPKGQITVSWRVRADDGEKQTGRWAFRVTDGATYDGR